MTISLDCKHQSSRSVERQFNFRFIFHLYDNRLKQLETESSLDSIFLGIARRVNNNSLLKQLKDLLVIYNIDDAVAVSIVEVAQTNLQWIAMYSSDIQNFLDDFFRSTASPLSTVSCFIIVFGLALNWIMQN